MLVKLAHNAGTVTCGCQRCVIAVGSRFKCREFAPVRYVVYIYIYIYTYTHYVCVYIYIYICISYLVYVQCMYIYIYIYVCIHKPRVEKFGDSLLSRANSRLKNIVGSGRTPNSQMFTSFGGCVPNGCDSIQCLNATTATSLTTKTRQQRHEQRQQQQQRHPSPCDRHVAGI